MRSVKFIVHGKVQGVYYRASVQAAAQKAGFSGYVKNLSDGTVEACVTCQNENLEKFRIILQNGSKLSRVDKIEEFMCKEEFTKGFVVKK
jgi:acylphosphatase